MRRYKQSYTERLYSRKKESKPGSAAAPVDPYGDGKIRIYLDDERPCPTGWTLARNVDELGKLLDFTPPDRIAEISLDWHLGTGVMNGHAAAALVSAALARQPAGYTSLRRIYCHSSDRDEAGTMARTIAQVVLEHEALERVRVRIGAAIIPEASSSAW